ncbi:MAG TPA: TetR/AcrR family transcriptional regulator [Burkholderiaceae bacterium]|nr:TetR/AcrR family transcriptional regulator [Burkholderiaceae bacterium]
MATPTAEPVAEPALDRPARQRRKQARPQELIDAALRLFVERGFAATRMEEIAALAGVSKGTLYLYYPGKEELLKAVIRERLSNEIKAVAAASALHQGAKAEMLRSLFVQWWLRAFESPASGVFKLVITEVRAFPEIAEIYDREVVEPGRRLIGGLLQAGIATGEFRPVEIEAAVHSLVLPMVMLCVHKHSLGACVPVESLRDPARFMRQHVDLVVRGLLATPPAPLRKPR